MGYAFVQTLAGEIQAAGGIVTAQDLLSAQPVVKQPITAQVCNANPTYPLCACVSDARTSLRAQRQDGSRERIPERGSE